MISNRQCHLRSLNNFLIYLEGYGIAKKLRNKKLIQKTDHQKFIDDSNLQRIRTFRNRSTDPSHNWQMIWAAEQCGKTKAMVFFRRMEENHIDIKTGNSRMDNAGSFIYLGGIVMWNDNCFKENARGYRLWKQLGAN